MLFVRFDFVRRSYDNYIALIRMDREVSFDNLIRPVCLPSKVDKLAGVEGTVVGWGLLKEKGEIPDGLHAIQLPVIPQALCKLTSRHRKKTQSRTTCSALDTWTGGGTLVKETVEDRS